MKFSQIITILAFLALIGCFTQPFASAADVTVNTTPKDNATSYYNNGDLLVVSGDYENAITLFDLALASDTSMINKTGGLLYLYRDKAYAQIQLNRYNDALSTLAAGLARYPQDPLLWNNRGYAFFRTGKLQDALDSYNTAISFDQNYTTALINKGDALSGMGRYSEAVEAYTKAEETDPGNEVATTGITTAKAAAAAAAESSARTTSIILVIVLIVAIGAAVWYFRFRKPCEPAPAEPAPEKDKKTKKKKK
jgi:tetratricopeptide (TPR) repeat protein